MNESSVTRDLLVVLRSHPYIVFKFSDRFTSGIPDISVCSPEGTTWLEIKYLKKEMQLSNYIQAERSGMIQLHKMNQLAVVTGRAWYLAYRSNLVEVWHPGLILEEIQSKIKKQGHFICYVPEYLYGAIGTDVVRDCRPTIFNCQHPHFVALKLCQMKERVHYVPGNG